MAPLGFLGGTIPRRTAAWASTTSRWRSASRRCRGSASTWAPRWGGPRAGRLGHPPVRDRGPEAAVPRPARPRRDVRRDGGDRAALGDRRGGDGDDGGPARGRVRAQWRQDLDLGHRPRRVVPDVRHARPRQGPRGVCAFVVERGFPGFTERPIRNKLAFRPAQVGELVFEDCRVPAENLIGREGEEGSGSPSAPWRTGASPWPAARWGSPRRVSTPR